MNLEESMNLSVHLYNDIREFKKLRRQLQRKVKGKE